MAAKKPSTGPLGGNDFKRFTQGVEDELEKRGFKTIPIPPTRPVADPDDDAFADELPTSSDDGDDTKPFIVYLPKPTPSSPPPPPPLL